jgi:electron transport complex protein RnfG
MNEHKRENFLQQAWLVLVLSLVFGGMLAGIQLALGPAIEANKVNETLLKVPELVVGEAQAQSLAPGTLEIKPLAVEVDKAGKKVRYSVYEAKRDGKLAGWVAKTSGSGYADKIELLIGFDPQVETITGLFVLDQKETPGLGNKIVTDAWRAQFLHKSTDARLAAVKGKASAPNEIDAVTGATISSKSVTNIINTAVADLKQPLADKAKGM